MENTRRARRVWEAHLEEVVGVEDAAAITDAFDRHVTEEYLDCALDRALDRALAQQSQQLMLQLTDRVTERVTERVSERLTGQLAAAWRRDLLLVSVAQFFALAGAVTWAVNP